MVLRELMSAVVCFLVYVDAFDLDTRLEVCYGLRLTS